MGYVDENLMPDERVVYSAELHRFIFVPPAILFVIGAFIMFSARGVEDFACVSGLGVILVVGAVLLSITRFIAFMTSEFAVTNKRVIVKVGLVRRRTVELLLQKVETVGVDQPILGRLLNFGTIIVTGTGGTKEPFSNIADPLEFRRQVQDQSSSSSAAPIHQPQQPLAQASSVATAALSPEKRFCTSCGTPAQAGSRFCASCGHALG